MDPALVLVAEVHERKCEQHGHEMSRVSRVSRVGSRKRQCGEFPVIRRLAGRLKCTTSLKSFYVRRWRKWRTLPM